MQDLHRFTESLGDESGRDHGHYVTAASQAQGSFVARKVMELAMAVG